jgi:hypothetical protein
LPEARGDPFLGNHGLGCFDGGDPDPMFIHETVESCDAKVRYYGELVAKHRRATLLPWLPGAPDAPEPARSSPW